MNLLQIKAATEQTTVMFTRQTDKLDQPTEWVSHWDNDKRIRVSMHRDVMGKIKADPNRTDLALKPAEIVNNTPEALEAGKKPYTRYIIIVPNNVELSA